jgi:hypothetical protein
MVSKVLLTKEDPSRWRISLFYVGLR